MISLHTLPPIVTKRAKRRGRGVGSNKGAKSGRGTTRHQKARTSIPMHFEGGQARVVKKYPLLRGKLRNKAIRPRLFTVRLSRLEKIADTEKITLDLLHERGIVPPGMSAKIVFDKPVSKALVIHMPVSDRVAQEIKKVGGSVSQTSNQ